MHIQATFTLDSFDQADPYDQRDGINLARASIKKTFIGGMEGTSSVDMLSARCPDGGAGYVAIERFDGRIGDKAGSFALLHVGTMTGESRWAKWPIVPGSGTGALAGIAGEGQIDMSDGVHSFTLTYTL